MALCCTREQKMPPLPGLPLLIGSPLFINYKKLQLFSENIGKNQQVRAPNPLIFDFVYIYLLISVIYLK